MTVPHAPNCGCPFRDIACPKLPEDQRYPAIPSKMIYTLVLHKGTMDVHTSASCQAVYHARQAQLDVQEIESDVHAELVGSVAAMQAGANDYKVHKCS